MKGVLFDLDGTLFDRDATVQALVGAQHAAFAPALAGVAATDYVARVLELDDHGFRNKTEVYATVVRELALPAGLAGELAEDFWRRYRQHGRPSPTRHRRCASFDGAASRPASSPTAAR